ncbi:hypothetical protein [Microbacterium sp. Root553]|uniref:hypothetical protein n=1 Tax=Microbacterium sp. Root553 TaxID=1736556 RepID=UPI000A88C39F|nr:hypothetical protein [Microbacterium sp. Root553]
MNEPRALVVDASGRADDLAGRLFVIACSLGITIGLIATAGMLLAAAAFTTASTFTIPFIATFEGFHDVGGMNAVTITGSWATSAGFAILLGFLLSVVILRVGQHRSSSNR